MSVPKRDLDRAVHTDGIESFWAPIKRAHKETYHRMSRKRLSRYVGSSLAARSLDTKDHMRLVVLGFEERNLPWKELTK